MVNTALGFLVCSSFFYYVWTEESLILAVSLFDSLLLLTSLSSLYVTALVRKQTFDRLLLQVTKDTAWLGLPFVQLTFDGLALWPNAIIRIFRPRGQVTRWCTLNLIVRLQPLKLYYLARHRLDRHLLHLLFRPKFSSPHPIQLNLTFVFRPARLLKKFNFSENIL